MELLLEVLCKPVGSVGEQELPHKLSITVEKLQHVLYVQAKWGICFTTAKVATYLPKLKDMRWINNSWGLRHCSVSESVNMGK